jgi:hypothetical protein
MDGVGDDQGIMTFRQRILENVPLHDLDARAFGFAGQPLACDGARPGQLEQRALQSMVSPQHRDQE